MPLAAHESLSPREQSSMNGTMDTNCKARKSLAMQIDRLDAMLDGLAENLNDAVASAVKEAVAVAVREAVQAVLKEVIAKQPVLVQNVTKTNTSALPIHAEVPLQKQGYLK